MEHTIPKMDESSNRFVPHPERIRVVVGDLLDLSVDAIVTAIPQSLRLEPELNRRLVTIAGEALDNFLVEYVHQPRHGEVFCVPGFALNVSHVLLTVLPEWKEDLDKEDRHILSCYRAAIDLAVQMGFMRIGFPAFIAGEGGFPANRAIRLAMQGIMECLRDPVQEVWIVCDSQAVAEEYQDRLASIHQTKIKS